MTWADDLNAGRQFEISLGRRVGSGAAGTVFEGTASITAGSVAIKQLHTNANTARYVELQAYINAAGPKLAAQVPGLPFAVVRSIDEGWVAVLSPWLSGESAEDPATLANLAQRGLNAQLSAAHSYARQSAALETNRFLVADNGPSNMIVAADNSANMCDIDNAGVLERNSNSKFQGILVPERDGLDVQHLLDPRLANGEIGRADRFSDLWTLAQAQHYILNAGLDGLYSIDVPSARSGTAGWPPPADGAWGQYQKAQMERLGEEVCSLFARAFTPLGGRWQGGSRPPAAEWRDALQSALKWVRDCTGCGEAIVSKYRQRCPFCGTPLPHAIVRVGSLPVLVDRPRTIPAELLGFSDGRYPALRIDRDPTGISFSMPSRGSATAGAGESFRVASASGAESTEVLVERV